MDHLVQTYRSRCVLRLRFIRNVRGTFDNRCCDLWSGGTKIRSGVDGDDERAIEESCPGAVPAESTKKSVRPSRVTLIAKWVCFSRWVLPKSASVTWSAPSPAMRYQRMFGRGLPLWIGALSHRGRGCSGRRHRQTGRAAHPAPQLRHSPAGGRHRHPDHPSPARHAKLNNTAFYTKVATRTVRTVTSPLDKLGIFQLEKISPDG